MADESAGFLPAAALESFRADLGLTYAQAGAVLAMMAPGGLAGTVLTAASDRVSRRVLAAGGALGFAAGMAAFALGGSFVVLAAAAFTMGAASTAMVDAAEVALVDLAGGDLRRHLARANLLGTVGDVAGPALVAVVASAGLSWRASFWVATVLLAAYAVGLALAPLPPPDARGGRAAPPGGVAAPRSALHVLVAVLRDRRVWVVGFLALLMAPFDEPLLGFTIALLQAEHGASAGVATLVSLVGVSGGLVAFTVVAGRCAHVPDRRLLVTAGVVMTAGTAAIAVLPVVALVAVAAFVAMIGLDLGWLALQHRTLTLRPGQVGTTKAVVSTIELVGFAIPVAVGAVADRVDLVAALATYGILGAGFTVLALLAGPRRAPRRPLLPRLRSPAAGAGPGRAPAAGGAPEATDDASGRRG